MTATTTIRLSEPTCEDKRKTGSSLVPSWRRHWACRRTAGVIGAVCVPMRLVASAANEASAPAGGCPGYAASAVRRSGAFAAFAALDDSAHSGDVLPWLDGATRRRP